MRLRRRRLSTVRRRPRDSLFRMLKVDFIVLGVLVLVGVGYWLHEHPIRLGTEGSPTASGEERTGQEQGDVLLLLPSPTPGHLAESLETLDYAAYWLNIVGQEFGPARVVALDQLAPPSFDRVGLLIVPRSVAREMTAGQVAIVEQFVEEGGHVVVELPMAAWQPLVGVVGEPSQTRASRRITAFDGAVVRGDLRDDVIQSPLPTVLSPVAMADVTGLDGAEVLMEVDGLPGFVRYSLGEGQIYVLYFELARAVASLEQGLPSADWEVARPSVPLPEGFTRTSALVADGRQRRASMPSADLLERQVLAVVTATRPTPRVWRFPGGRSAALVMTHSAVPDWESGRYMLDWERDAEVGSTLFVDATALGQLPAGDAADVGLLLVPPTLESAPVQPVGVLGFHPMERPLSLTQQMEALARFGDGALTLARMTDGLWDPQFGRSFEELAGLGVDVDSSYGPAFAPTDTEAGDGYAFGTGLPYRPIDRNGLLFPLWEVPVVLQDGESLAPEWAENLLERAGRAYHEAIVADWRTGTMIDAPRAGVVSTWRRLFEIAAEDDYWVTDLETFVRFWELRNEVRLRSEFNPGERRLSVWAETAALPVETGEALTPALAFESRYEDRPIERITRNGEDVPFVELGRSADGVLSIYALPAGTSRVEITYQGPIVIEEQP